MLKLKTLATDFNLFGLKTSFEDEGASVDDVIEIVRLNNKFNLKTTLKIGGCESRSDMIIAQNLDIDNIVAPMIESKFAACKYVDSVHDIYGIKPENNKFYINIESIMGVKNAEEIIAEIKEHIAGVVVGRSDLSRSLGLTKKATNSDEILKHTHHVLSIAKKYNLETTFGGNLNSESIDFIKELKKDNLIDRVETRTVICRVDDYLIKHYQKFIDTAIEVEKDILQNRSRAISSRLAKINQRIISISGRKTFLKTVATGEESVLAIDFDNVIHNMTMGYHDGTIYGDEVVGTHEALKILSTKYQLVIWTCKANPMRPLVNEKTGTELILDWLKEKNLEQFITRVTFGKPNAAAYIDDRAIEFFNWESCIQKLKKRDLI